MDVSVILCTHNRCESLRQTLEQFRALNCPTNLGWELLVLDNNSTDQTQQVCQGFKDQLPVRCVFESRQGKSCALNRSLQEARGDLLLFTDDDVDVDNNWIAEYRAAAARWPKMSFFGGKVIPRWERTPPKWLAEHSKTLLRTVAVSFDLGDEEQPWIDLRHPFIGANLACRKQVFIETGLAFREDLGPKGGEAVRGEEAWLIQQFTQHGLTGAYVPSAIVHHRNPVARMTETYVREWFKGDGMRAVRLGQLPASRHVWFGAPRYLWGQFLASLVFFSLTRLTRPSQIWLRHECRLALKWGSICEFRHVRKNAEVK